MTTKPILIPAADKERRLSINFATSAAGSIRVELLSPGGEVLNGFAAQDCDELIGDRVNRIVGWKGKTDLSELAGKAVRLQFLMKDANLYALQFK